MPRLSFAYRIDGIEPKTDPAWIAAGPDVRAEFWRAVVAIGLEVKDDELAAGLDAYGRELVPIAESTRRNRHSEMGPADPNAPPLTPAHGLSRTRSLLTGRAHDGYALFYWTSFNGVHWGRILGYHRAGGGRLPVRDVIGLSAKGRAKVKRRALEWWRARKVGIRLEAQSARFRFRAEPASGPKVAPRKIPVVGRTDTENFTFGIAGDKSLVDRAIAAGQFTGFRQRRPPANTGGTRAAGPTRPKPTPATPAGRTRRAAKRPVKRES